MTKKDPLTTSTDEVNRWIGLYQQSHHGDCPPISAFVEEYPEWLRVERERNP